LFTIDTHLHHFAQNILLELGNWLRRKVEMVELKRKRALGVLQQSGYTQDELRAAWTEQVKMQSKVLPRKSGNTTIFRDLPTNFRAIKEAGQ